MTEIDYEAAVEAAAVANTEATKEIQHALNAVHLAVTMLHSSLEVMRTPFASGWHSYSNAIHAVARAQAEQEKTYDALLRAGHARDMAAKA